MLKINKKQLSGITKNVMEERKFKIPDFDFTPPKYEGLSFEEVKEKRKKFLSPSLSTFQAFKTPFYNTRGKKQYIYDSFDNRYLDLLAQNLTISCGHNHRIFFIKQKQGKQYQIIPKNCQCC
jgi:4-aminobutyrate aminotransferase-like enzyme